MDLEIKKDTNIKTANAIINAPCGLTSIAIRALITIERTQQIATHHSGTLPYIIEAPHGKHTPNPRFVS